MSVDFSAIIDNFLTAELGEDVRGSLVDIAEALQDAINSQLLTVTTDLSDNDPNAAAQAKAVGDIIYENKDRTKNTPHVMSWFNDAANLSSLDDMPAWSITSANGTKWKTLIDDSFPNMEDITDSTTYIMQKEAYGESTATFYRYIFSNLAGTRIWFAYKLANSSTVSWFRSVQPTDTALSIERRPADAKAVGDIIYGNKDRTKNTPQIYTWFSDGSTLTSLDNMPPFSKAIALGSKWKTLIDMDVFPDGEHLSDNLSYFMQKELYGNTLQFQRFFLSTLGGTRIWIGYNYTNHPALYWTRSVRPTSDDNKIRVLVFGNSYTYSDLGLLPAIMSDMGFYCNLGIAYISGGSIYDHITALDNDTVYAEYSEFNGTSWDNTASEYTAENILDLHEWDYIVFTVNTEQATYSTAQTLAEKILSYINQRYGVDFIYHMAHVKGPNDRTFTSHTLNESNELFYGLSDYSKAIMYDSSDPSSPHPGDIMSDVLPCAAAVQNARQLQIFQGVGDEGYLCEDDRSHLQNGIGTLIPAYAAAIKFAKLKGIPAHIFGEPLTPDDTWLNNTYKLFTASSHGACEYADSTNVIAEKILAARCAVQANKTPYNIVDITTGAVVTDTRGG